jgi:hypothetical protein
MSTHIQIADMMTFTASISAVDALEAVKDTVIEDITEAMTITALAIQIIEEQCAVVEDMPDHPRQLIHQRLMQLAEKFAVTATA